MFVCETCGYESKDHGIMKKHEAAHLGLSVEEMERYDELKSMVISMASLKYDKNNEQTEKAYDAAVANLMKFKMDHGLVQ